MGSRKTPPRTSHASASPASPHLFAVVRRWRGEAYCRTRRSYCFARNAVSSSCNRQFPVRPSTWNECDIVVSFCLHSAMSPEVFDNNGWVLCDMHHRVGHREGGFAEGCLLAVSRRTMSFFYAAIRPATAYGASSWFCPVLLWCVENMEIKARKSWLRVTGSKMQTAAIASLGHGTITTPRDRERGRLEVSDLASGISTNFRAWFRVTLSDLQRSFSQSAPFTLRHEHLSSSLQASPPGCLTSALGRQYFHSASGQK